MRACSTVVFGIPARHRCVRFARWSTTCWPRSDAEFELLYEGTGRQSVAPERLLRAKRQLMEQIDCRLLFRWFVGLGIDDHVWDDSTFSKNRDRLLGAEVAAKSWRPCCATPSSRASSQTSTSPSTARSLTRGRA